MARASRGGAAVTSIRRTGRVVRLQVGSRTTLSILLSCGWGITGERDPSHVLPWTIEMTDGLKEFQEALPQRHRLERELAQPDRQPPTTPVPVRAVEHSCAGSATLRASTVVTEVPRLNVVPITNDER